MRHPHADVIHAYAEGAKIEIRNGKEWELTINPVFYSEFEYRIKPTPKPDLVCYYHAVPNRMPQLVGDNLKLTFDGDTGVLKYSEVLA